MAHAADPDADRNARPRGALVAAAGLQIEMGAFVAFFIVSVIVTPIAERLRLPFAGIAFASVVDFAEGFAPTWR